METVLTEFEVIKSRLKLFRKDDKKSFSPVSVCSHVVVLTLVINAAAEVTARTLLNNCLCESVGLRKEAELSQQKQLETWLRAQMIGYPNGQTTGNA